MASARASVALVVRLCKTRAGGDADVSYRDVEETTKERGHAAEKAASAAPAATASGEGDGTEDSTPCHFSRWTAENAARGRSHSIATRASRDLGERAQ